MSKAIVYSCVFFNEKYVNLINLLLKSYKLFGNSSDNVDYLIICNSDYQKKIQELFDNLNINGKIWCLDLKTMFEAGYSRLKIFNYPDINLYDKILYLDCDILVTNSINNILDFQLENKLYALQEGNTNHHYWGQQFFGKNNPKYEAFTSGILLFNNNIIIKDLFSQILLHINNHITSKLSIPGCLDQPFIVYHAVKNNLYDNQKLINIVINNPNKSDRWRPKQIHQNYNGQTICHFPGEPGFYENKIEKMSNFMNDIMFNIDKNTNTDIVLFYKKYKWGDSSITFLENGKMDAFGEGKYIFIDKYLVKCYFGDREHLLKFNENYSQFISVRKSDFDVILGCKYDKKLIPKIIMQTAKNKPERYIINIINQKCPEWRYIHFIDSEIIQYFKENPIQEFPNIIEKFNSFSKGQHKADLFRYYYLYLNGGIFLDSDAIFEVNIDDIIKSYDSVFVKSFMPNTHLFNGFIATYPKNPIIYDALKHAYKTEDTILQKHYHYLCEELWRIYYKHNFTNMKIYQEHNKSHEGYGGSVILDDNGDKIISHYWKSKKIPNYYYKINMSNMIKINKYETRYLDTSLLRVYNTPNKLIRIGPNEDGGYVILDNLEYDHFISCGIDKDIRFEIDFLNKYSHLNCNAFDGTINTFPNNNKNIKWIKKNIDEENSDTTSNLVEYITNYHNIFLKMDIEGSEFNWIDSMNTEHLKRFSQITIEFHWPYDKYRYGILTKLLNTHLIVHMHGNNGPGLIKIGRENLNIPEVLELTLIRRDIFNNDEIECITQRYPINNLDYGNHPNQNIPQLEFTIFSDKTIHVGSSNNNNKEIILPSSLDINNINICNIPVNKQEIGWNDTFFTKIVENKLIVSRTDLNCGWGQDLIFEFWLNKISKVTNISKYNNKLSQKILLYNGFPFHFEMFGCVLDYAKKYNLDVDIVNTTDDNHQWFSLYEKYFTFNLYNSLSNIDVTGYHSVILLTDDDYSFPKNLVSENTICINHFHISRRNDIKYQLTISKFEEDIDKYCFPIWNCITHEEKVNILKHNNKPIITLIGNSNIHKTNNIKKIIKNHQDFEFRLINRNIPNNIPNFIKTYKNLNSIELFNILKQTSYVLYLQSNDTNSIDQQNNRTISGCFPLAISNGCQLIVPNGIMKPLNLKSIIYYDIDNPIQLNKITNLEKVFYDRDRLTDIKNHSLATSIPYNKTDWNNYNRQEINEFDPRVLIGYDCPNPLIRVGPKSDGGYVMVDGFNYDHFLSCGIAGDIRFELALLDKYPNLKCDAFDGTINTFPQHNKNINWEKKNVGYINSEKITNLKPYLKDYKNIFLKIDIEGSEFNWIDSMSLEDLNCFSQIVMEIHWPFDKYRCEMLEKLNQTHYVVHIHGNNYCDRDIPKHLPSGRSYDGTLTIKHSNYPSIKLPEVFEITYIRKSNFIDNLNKIRKKYPTPLDSPNNPNTKDTEFTILV